MLILARIQMNNHMFIFSYFMLSCTKKTPFCKIILIFVVLLLAGSKMTEMIFAKVGFELERSFDGKASNLVESCGKSAVKLVALIAQHFPGIVALLQTVFLLFVLRRADKITSLTFCY